jgi:glycogen operon protein
MVSALHAAGIEVIVDFVPNHTAEGGVGGTTLCYRGLGRPRVLPLGGAGHDADITGTGNTLDAGSPTVIGSCATPCGTGRRARASTASASTWASVLGRPARAVRPERPLLTAIALDPVLSRVKLIAEPWDATGEGYRVGGFGVAWSEWNGRYRDAVRDFWRGHGGIGEVASRLSGSSTSTSRGGRRPGLGQLHHRPRRLHPARPRLLRAQAQRGNGEDNRDGHRRQPLRNFGVEGETTSPVIRARRLAAARAMIGTLMLSTAPMLLGGDEWWRTQRWQQQRLLRRRRHVGVDWTPRPEQASMAASRPG